MHSLFHSYVSQMHTINSNEAALIITYWDCNNLCIYLKKRKLENIKNNQKKSEKTFFFKYFFYISFILVLKGALLAVWYYNYSKRNCSLLSFSFSSHSRLILQQKKEEKSSSLNLSLSLPALIYKIWKKYSLIFSSSFVRSLATTLT